MNQCAIGGSKQCKHKSLATNKKGGKFIPVYIYINNHKCSLTGVVPSPNSVVVIVEVALAVVVLVYDRYLCSWMGLIGCHLGFGGSFWKVKHISTDIKLLFHACIPMIFHL